MCYKSKVYIDCLPKVWMHILIHYKSIVVSKQFTVYVSLLFSLVLCVSHHLQALVKRSPSSGMGSTLKESSAFQSELRMPESAIRHQNASPSDKGKVTICDGKSGDEDRPKKSSVCKSIEGCQEELLTQVVRENIFSGCITISVSCLVSL